MHTRTRHFSRPSRRAIIVRALAFFAVVVAGLTVSTVARAQSSRRAALTNRVFVGGHLQVTDPRGEFGENTGTGGGVGVAAWLRLDPNGAFNLRADLGVVGYGSSTRRIPFANTRGLADEPTL